MLKMVSVGNLVKMLKAVNVTLGKFVKVMRAGLVVMQMVT
jgi:hypothetical protein